MQVGWRVVITPFEMNEALDVRYGWDVVWQYAEGDDAYRRHGGAAGDAQTPAAAAAAARREKARLERERPTGL